MFGSLDEPLVLALELPRPESREYSSVERIGFHIKLICRINKKLQHLFELLLTFDSETWTTGEKQDGIIQAVELRFLRSLVEKKKKKTRA